MTDMTASTLTPPALILARGAPPIVPKELSLEFLPILSHEQDTKQQQQRHLTTKTYLRAHGLSNMAIQLDICAQYRCVNED